MTYRSDAARRVTAVQQQLAQIVWAQAWALRLRCAHADTIGLGRVAVARYCLHCRTVIR